MKLMVPGSMVYPNQHRWFDGETWTAEIEPVVGETGRVKSRDCSTSFTAPLGCGPPC
ncbi:MAG: DUF2510 domain-containing protein [Candidatus Microthrix sp.]|nr:DUF2510 domain-containing protein [Candidatus Microthrix sp.]